jgi:hypothetical protein
MSGRWRSLAATLFLKAQPLGMHEVPDRPVINLKSALGEFATKPVRWNPRSFDSPQQRGAVLARNRLRLVPAHLARLATGVPRPGGRQREKASMGPAPEYTTG